MTDNNNNSGEATNNTELVPARKDASLASGKQPFRIKPVGLAARKAAYAAKQRAEGVEVPIDINPQDCEHKIGIVFDDSASMGGQKIADAHAGTEEFLRSCNPKNTAIAVYPMNPSGDGIFGDVGHSRIPLTNKMATAAVVIKSYDATGSTPLFSTLEAMLENETLTRGIIFSDGEPNYGDRDRMDDTIAKAIEKHIPVDTVFIGHKSDTRAIEIMQTIAERTGGVFLIFDPTKSNFRTAFKYLSPGYRAMLADKSFVNDLQEGKV